MSNKFYELAPGNFRFPQRLPMGDENAPMYFNNILRHILKEVKNARPYFDDTLIGADTAEEFVDTVKQILSQNKTYNGVIDRSKVK